MRRFLLPLLICPACLPKEQPLALAGASEADGEIVSGTLECRRCRRRFPIRDGSAVLLPDPAAGPAGSQWKYEEAGTLDSYLWSHFADLAGDRQAGDAYATWADCLAPRSAAALDAGCAVGRLTFEMAARSELAVGCDLSLAFIRTARRLAREGELTFSLPIEGNLRETFRCTLPPVWRHASVEFVVADALALPFARESFDQLASLNLLDRVSYPLAHLYELNRVARPAGAALLFADPFSWSTAAAPEERWLGGTTAGPYPGRGLDNVRALLEGKDGILRPPWRIARDGEISWKLRSHRNHCELITSQLLVAER